MAAKFALLTPRSQVLRWTPPLSSSSDLTACFSCQTNNDEGQLEALWQRTGIAPAESVEQTAYESLRPETPPTGLGKAGTLTHKTAAH